VPVVWRTGTEQRYRLRLHAQGRGLLSDALNAIAAAGAYVLASHAAAQPDGSAALAFEVEVRDSAHGTQVQQRLRDTDGISSVRRR
jgi:(p)ppGpp synthase/HD superfamily hydrolase